jgi:drug/metabolite transporter (DMT)-like permease
VVLSGSFLALMSATLWAGANVVIKSLSRRLGPWAALLWAQILGLAMALPCAIVFEGAPRLPPASSWVALAAAVVASCLGYAGLFQALGSGQVAVVTPIMSSWSALSVAIGVVLRDEPLRWTGAVGVLMVIAGNWLLTHQRDRAAGGTPRAALVWALVAMLGFGVMVPAVDAVGEAVGRLWAVPTVWSLQLALTLPLLARYRLLARPRRREWRWALLAGALEVGGFVALSFALSLAPLTVVSPLSSLTAALSVTYGFVVLRERLPHGALLGALAASVGVVLVNI